MNIIMLSSEVFPFAKAGGLGDVVPQLSEELSRSGNTVKILMPRYKLVETSGLNLLPISLHIPLAGKNFHIKLYSSFLEQGTEVFFLEHAELFASRGLYADEAGTEYPDNLLRFTILSEAVFPLCRKLGWYPDIIHAHDWHAALSMSRARDETDFSETASIFSIHNIGYQGIFDIEKLSDIGMSNEEYHERGLAYHGKICLLQSALSCADYITTVSPTYADEILGDTFGFGMQNILRKRRNRLIGILNGADYRLWNPAADTMIPHHYDHENPEAKTLNKTFAQETYGLKIDHELPLVGIVSRLVEQKGFRFLLGNRGQHLLNILNELKLQFIVLGTGDKQIEEDFQRIAADRNDIAVIINYDESLSHLIQAASDFFLVPSLYEPCGLTQIYALRYGSLPIVSRTGGLLDTVNDINENPEIGTGILIGGNSDDTADSVGKPDTVVTEGTIFHALQQAADVWQDHQRYYGGRIRAMHQHFGWEESAQQYQQVYDKACWQRTARGEVEK